MDSYLCDMPISYCDRDKSKPIDRDRLGSMFIFDPIWSMVEEFVSRNTSNYLNERIMLFDDWEEYIPIITPERVATPIEATLPFFTVPIERKHVRLDYTDDFENQDVLWLKRLTRSIWDVSGRVKEGNMAAPRFMD